MVLSKRNNIGINSTQLTQMNSPKKAPTNRGFFINPERKNVYKRNCQFVHINKK
jgi:hypothetical protein